MAINAPSRLNTDITSRDYSNPDRDAAARLMEKASLAGVADDSLTKFLLGEQGKNADLKKIKDMNLKPGQTAKVGDVSINDSAEGRLAAQALKDSKKDDKDFDKRKSAQATLLQKTYGKITGELEGGLSQVESGLAGINEGSKQGDKTAIAAITRLADGKGQRMTQAQLASMTPKSAQGDLTAFKNYWAAKAESGLSPEERAATKSLFQAHQSRLASELDDTMAQMKEQAPFLAPDLQKSGQLESYTGTFGGKAKSMLARLGEMSKSEVKQAQTNNPGILPKIAGGAIGGLKSLLFGAGSQGQPQSPTPQSAPPSPQQGLGQLIKPQAPPQPAMLRVKSKSTGQMGSLPANEFDPNQYDKI